MTFAGAWRRSRRRYVAWALVLLAFLVVNCLIVRRAQAQTEVHKTEALSSVPLKVDAKDAARAHFLEGVRFGKLQQYALARTQFRRANELFPHAASYFNLALSEQALGMKAQAYCNLQVALDRARKEVSELPEDSAVQALRLVQELEGQLILVDIEALGADWRLAVDGAQLARHEIDQGVLMTPKVPAVSGETLLLRQRVRLVLEPGSRELGLNARHQRARVSVAGVGGEKKSFQFTAPPVTQPAVNASTRDVLVEPPAGQLAMNTVHSVHTAPPRLTSSPHRESPGADAQTWRWVSYGSAAAGLTTAAVFGTLALLKKRKLERQCPTKDRCPLGSASLKRDITRYARIADIGFAVTLVGGGLTLYLELSPSSTLASSAAAFSLNGQF